MTGDFKVYGVGPWYRRILWEYWDILRMLRRTGEYYGADFKGLRGVVLGYPLYPTIFNVVVDSVLRHWVLLV